MTKVGGIGPFARGLLIGVANYWGSQSQARYVVANEKYQSCIQVVYDRFPNDRNGPAATAGWEACSATYKASVP